MTIKEEVFHYLDITVRLKDKKKGRWSNQRSAQIARALMPRFPTLDEFFLTLFVRQWRQAYVIKAKKSPLKKIPRNPIEHHRPNPEKEIK